MGDPALRFLLDQNFPEVGPLDPQAVDRSVEYVHLRVWNPALTAGTPDWLIYLEAELGRFAGLVTKDWRQSIQAEEAFALTHTKLTVVTWREPPNDPVVEWAMLIAYMPEIRRILSGRRDPPVIFLPSPKLTQTNLLKREEALGRSARERGISTAQARHEAQANILDYLASEGKRQALVDLATRKPRRQAPGSRLQGPPPTRKAHGAKSAPLPTQPT